ncbi:MAG TPA: RodZ domain-containing protein [Sphingomicrobium sp.]|jgi:cytoskeletal protein RodZ|nr:RodZ domain-containing protein [Sphingomicrobium sp.]
MAKREVEEEPVDEELVEADSPTVGDRLKAAREEKGLNLEDIAAQTRIPQRHLESIEVADWEKLPAPTYTVGFAKSYASAVGLDRTEIGDQLREEMGGQRFASSQAEVIEAADPARTMPKWLVISAVIAVILLIIVMSMLNRRSLEQPSEAASNAPAAAAPASPPASVPAQQKAALPAPAAAVEGPVVLAAVAPAWIQVTDQGKTLFEGMLQPGQTYSVPPSAAEPLLKAGKPEALKVTVGSAVAPPVGPAGKVASKVSLKGADLMRGGAAQPAAGQ